MLIYPSSLRWDNANNELDSIAKNSNEKALILKQVIQEFAVEYKSLEKDIIVEGLTA